MQEYQEYGGRVPPSSMEAERSVLGAMMQDGQAVSLALEMLQEDDFFSPANREMFSAMRALFAQAKPIDLVTLDAELSRRGTLDGVGGAAYLVDTSQYVPTTANVRAYIDIVEEKSTLRRLLSASGEITQNCYQQQLPTEEILQHAEKSIFDISMRKGGGDSLMHIAQLLPDSMGQIETLHKNKGAINGVGTGYYDLDNLLTGLHPGELVLLGARPSMGKTSMAMNMVQHAAVMEGKTAAVFSLEMPREQLVMRMLCSDARVNMQSVRHGNLHDEDWVKLTQAMGPLAASQMYLDDTSGISPTQLRSRARRLKMERGLDLIMIDYLQLMGSDKRTDNRQQEVSDISRQLKGIAQELRVPLIACAQLSRAGAQRSDKRPILSDLRDSGSMEQDADVVLFLHREDYYDPMTEDKNVAELIIAKQRNGPLGTVRLAFMKEYTTFASLAPGTGLSQGE